VGGAADAPPEPLDGAILFAPAGELAPVALRALDRGATLAVAGIWLSDIPALHYEAELFEERRLRSVTANTRADGEEFLALAHRFGIRPTTTAYPMADAPPRARRPAPRPVQRRGGAAQLSRVRRRRSILDGSAGRLCIVRDRAHRQSRKGDRVTQTPEAQPSAR
jgi:propanol-preferring alcohol dehydrogenase